MFSNVIKSYNVCDKTLSDITDANGFISSPGYPSYTPSSTLCTQKIIAPSNKLIKAWIASDIKSDTK